MGMPARIVQFLYLTARELLLPDFIDKPAKVVTNFYQCFLAADPAEAVALLADAKSLTDRDVEALVDQFAVLWKPLLRGANLSDAQRAMLRQMVLGLHTAGQPAAAADPAKALRQSLQLGTVPAMEPAQREVRRTMVHAALHRNGSTSEPLPSDAPTIAGYTLLRLLGRGAFSTVYLARNSADEFRAVKVFRPESAELFDREVALLGAVKGDYLVRHYDQGRLANGCWIAMEYLGDFTLGDLIASRPTTEQSLVLAEQVLRGLDELHRAKVIHRDLKPENAVVGADYRLRLIDFGLSKHQESAGVSTTMNAAGTALYMSPEQIESKAGFASDVWAFGCVLYELLVGQPLFNGANLMQVATKIANQQIRCDADAIPLEVREFLAKCLQRDASKRYANAGAALTEFAPIITTTRKRLRYERFYTVWGSVLDQRLLEKFAEEHHGEMPADGVQKFAAFVRGAGIAEVDEQRLAEILPAVFESQKQVHAAERHLGETKQKFQREAGTLSGDQLVRRAETIRKLEASPGERRENVRKVAEAQLATERAGWDRHKKAEEDRIRESQAAAVRQLVAETEAEAREGAKVVAGVVVVLLLIGGAIWGVVMPTPAPQVTPVELAAARDAFASKSGLPVRKSLHHNGAKFDFVLIHLGSFTMGTPGNTGNEKPHPVKITKPYYMLTTEVTQGMFEAVMGASANQSNWKGDKLLPVEQVSWVEANTFCEKLSKTLWETIQLPSEAQWEYAYRAGSTTQYFFGDSDSALGEYAWFGSNSGRKTHPVGTRKPNAFGLYGMAGNVWEWCSDAYRSDYEKLAAKDPRNDGSSDDRHVVRGCSWNHYDGFCRAAYRSYKAGDRLISSGFRVVLFP